MSGGLGAIVKRAIERRFNQLITKVIISAVNDTGLDARGLESHQRVDVTTFAGEQELRDKTHLEQYGFSGVPLVGAEGLGFQVGGSRGRLVVICVGDPRTRPTGRTAGEVQMWTDEGSVLHAKRGRESELRGAILDAIFSGEAKLEGGTLNLDASSGDANIDATGALNLSGATVVIVGPVTLEGKAWLPHTHAAGALLDSTPAPVTGVTGGVI